MNLNKYGAAAIGLDIVCWAGLAFFAAHYFACGTQ